jgi:hypothetical protein
MAFMGEIRDIGVADLLYLLAIRQQSGRLSITANGDEVSIFIDYGRMVVVTSSNPSFRLGRMLIQLDYLSDAQLRDALKFQEHQGAGRSLGSILVHENFVTDQQLSHCIEEQCIEVLARIIAVDNGVFVFHLGEKVAPRTEMIPLNSDRILLEATRRTDALAALKSALPDPLVPLTVTDLVDRYAEELTDIEVQITALLFENPTNLRDLEMAVAGPDIDIWRAIVGLRGREIIRAINESTAPHRDRAHVRTAASS